MSKFKYDSYYSCENIWIVWKTLKNCREWKKLLILKIFVHEKEENKKKGNWEIILQWVLPFFYPVFSW